MKLSSPSPFPNFPSSSSSIDAGASAARAGCQGKEREREKGAFSPSCLFRESRRRWTKGDHNEGGGEEGKERMLLLSPQVFPTTQEGRKRGACGRDCPLAGDSPSIPRDFFELCSLEYCTIRKEYAIYFDSINTIFPTIEEGSFKSSPPRLIGPGLLDNRTLMTTMTEREKTQHAHPKRK